MNQTHFKHQNNKNSNTHKSTTRHLRLTPSQTLLHTKEQKVRKFVHPIARGEKKNPHRFLSSKT